MEGEKSSEKMIEQAKEELEMLETQHLNRFGYLKMELKSFILLLESQYNNNNPISLPTYSTAAATQEMEHSSTREGTGLIWCLRRLNLVFGKFSNFDHKSPPQPPYYYKSPPRHPSYYYKSPPPYHNSPPPPKVY
ncbi:hypothetical protein OWV82_013557 [Melia azedarach]|uniref:Uncharacterized protein n=1 Tax=Melia azedarach TaxID=155640 RepID=A0ACC1XWT4_MELAZ|nr:hypothetical protein OWV82_013557 [Melia azedarach]